MSAKKSPKKQSQYLYVMPTMPLEENVDESNRPIPGEPLDRNNHFREIRDYRYHYVAICYSESNAQLDYVRDRIKATVPTEHLERKLLSEAVKIRRSELNPPKETN